MGQIGSMRFFLPHKYSPALGIFSFLTAKSGADVVFIGSSRTRYGIRPKSFCRKMADAGFQDMRTFNIGMNSTEITTHYLITRDYLTRARKPKILFLEVGPRSFNVNSARKLDAWRYFADVTDVPTLIGFARNAEEYSAAISIIWRGFVVVSELSRAEYIKRAVANFRRIHDGAEPRQAYKILKGRKSWAQLVRGMTKTVRKRVLKDYRITKETGGALEGIINICKKRGIKLVLIRYPVSSEYERIVGEEIERIYVHFIKRILKRYPMSYIDLSEVEWKDNRKYFWDPQHPSLLGAQKITNEIARQFIKCCAPRTSLYPKGAHPKSSLRQKSPLR